MLHHIPPKKDEKLNIKPWSSWHYVCEVEYKEHRKKKDGKEGPSSLRVSYICENMRLFKEWVCINHTGPIREKALEWLRQRIEDPCIDAEDVTLQDIISGAVSLREPERIRVEKEGPHEQVREADFGED